MIPRREDGLGPEAEIRRRPQRGEKTFRHAEASFQNFKKF